jgi:uncharacterized RDD family membrane protein YckC
MNQPPQPPPDPNGLTQPIPVVPPPQSQSQSQSQAQPPPAPPAAGAPRPPYVHRFGNVPAYLLARLGAFLVDTFGVGFVLATFAFHAFEAGYLTIGGRDEGGFLALAGYSFAIAFAFACLCEALLGTTLGKALFALHTRSVDGRHAGPGRVFVRYLLRPIDVLLIGPILALVTARHRRLGDFLGGTVVSRSSIGAFATVIGVVLLVALAYAQIAFGGGLTSAIEVSADAANFTPDLAAKTVHAMGLGAAPLPLVPVPATPAPLSTALATPAPLATSTPFATSAPAGSSQTAGTPNPAASELPSGVEPSDEPQPRATNSVVNE